MYSLPKSGEVNTTTRYLVTGNLSRSRVWPNPAGMYLSPPTSQNSCCGQPTLIQVPTIDENKTQTSWPDMFGNSRHQIDTKRSQKQQAGPRAISPLSSYRLAEIGLALHSRRSRCKMIRLLIASLNRV